MTVTTEPIASSAPTGTPTPSRPAGVVIPQYGIGRIVAVWAAAALPMAALAWIAAPRLADQLHGGNPLTRALIVCLAVGLVWQFFLVAGLVFFEQHTLRWSVVRDALWLRAPRNPRTGRVGGKTWLILVPCILGVALEEMLPSVSPAAARDLGAFFGSTAGHTFMHGNWPWFALLVTMFVFNTVLGEELLFRGFLLPRMNGAFGRYDWVANGVLFAGYHMHVPWVIPSTLLDMFFVVYPSKRYRSALIGIIVHSVQTVFFTVIALALVLGH